MMYLFTHTDLDGVGSAAVYLILKGKRLGDSGISVTYSEPYNIHQRMMDYIPYIEKQDRVVVSDIGINPKIYVELRDVLRKVLERNATIEWYDHHKWSDKWINEFTKLRIDLHVDTSTCATGVVARYAKPEIWINGEIKKTVEELVYSVCAADLWKWDHYLAPRLFRIVTLNGSQGEIRRNMVLRKFTDQKIWDNELEELLEDYVNVELKNYSKLDKGLVRMCSKNCCLGLTVKNRGPPTNSFVGAYVLSRFNVDMACIAKSNGSLSLRSRKVDVQKVALALGGGGHSRAAGAKIDLSTIDVLLFNFYPRLFLRRIGRKILKIAESSQACDVQ
ncbi:MAG: DHHA1 domain-containing protein [Desulfurococcales archaeon]|nr:DHHA1 domain-containing protein [Desulfurococcales archaeon]